MTAGAHKASVTIDARVDSADRDIKKLTRRINGMEKELARADKAARSNSEALQKVGRVGAYAATAAAGATVALFKLAEASAETANKTAKAAKGLGVASDGLQKLEFATSRATTATSEQLHKAIGVLTVGLQDAVTKGTGPVAEGLKMIGLTAADLAGQSIDQQFETLSRAVLSLPDANEQAAAAMKLFGQRAGQALAPLLKEGPAALRAYGDEAQRLGLVLDEQALKASEDFVDSVSDMKQTVSAVARDIGIAAIPAFKDAADGVKEWTVENKELIDQNVPKAIDAITTALGGAANAFVWATDKASGLGDVLYDLNKWGEDLDAWFGLGEGSDTGITFAPGMQKLAEENSARLKAERDKATAGENLGAAIAAGMAIYDRLDDADVQAEYKRRTKKRRSGSTGKGGGRREQQDLMESMLERDQSRLNAFSEDVADMSFLGSGTADPFSAENRQIYLDELARVAEEERQIERARRDGLLQDELDSLEMRRELGVDPMVLLEQEQQARLAHNDFLLQQANGEAEILRLQNERRGIYHDAEMKRLKVEQQQQQQRMQVMTEVSHGLDTLYRSTAEAALASAFAQGQSVKEAVKGTAKAESMRAAITATASFVQAAFWSAVPGGQLKAAQFLNAGAIASASAVGFGLIAGAASGTDGIRSLARGKFGRMSVGGTEGALDGSAFGPGSRALPSGAESTSADGSAAPGSSSNVPGSPTTATPHSQIGDPWTGQASGSPGTPPGSSRTNSGQPTMVFQGPLHFYGAGGPDDFIESVTRGQERLRLKRRR